MGAPTAAAQLTAKNALRNRMRRRRNKHPAPVRIAEGPLKEPVHIELVNPANALLARTNCPSQPEPSESRQTSKRPAPRSAVAADHKAGPKNDLPLRRQHARLKRFFPSLPDEWRQAIAGRRIFRANDARRVAIDMRRAHLNPDRRRQINCPHRGRKTRVDSTRDLRISSWRSGVLTQSTLRPTRLTSPAAPSSSRFQSPSVRASLQAMCRQGPAARGVCRDKRTIE